MVSAIDLFTTTFLSGRPVAAVAAPGEVDATPQID
jgi:hypothetical protein